MGHPSRKVLLALQDPHVTRSLSDWLREHGYGAVRAQDGASALLAVHREQPDAAVVEAELPVLDGYQFVAALRSRPETCRFPIVLVTPPGDAEGFARGCAAGADICMPRDGSPSDLLISLARILCAGPGASAQLAPCLS